MEQEPYILKVPTDVFELKIVINMSDFERKLLAQDNVLAANAKMISEVQNSIKGMKNLIY